jgi:autotransporter translocation and assembly factor TamB
MKKRTAVWIFTPPLLVLLAGMLAWGWLMQTESGSRWLFNRLAASVPGSLGAESLAGDFSSGLHLRRLLYEDDHTRVEAEELTLALSADLLPPGIRLDTADIKTLAVYSLQDSSGPVDLKETVSAAASPIALHFDSIRISGFDYWNAAGEIPVSVDSIELSGSLSSQLTLDHGLVKRASNQLTFGGNLVLAPPHALKLFLETSGDAAIRADASGDLERADLEIHSESPALVVEGFVTQILESPRWDLEITSPRLEWPMTPDSPTVTLTALAAQSTGTFADYRIDLQGLMGLPDMRPVQLDVSGAGNTQSIEVSRFMLSSTQLSLSGNGAIYWADQPGIHLDAELDRLDPGAWIDVWPVDRAVSGYLTMQWRDRQLHVPRLELSVQGTAATASGQGRVDLQAGSVNGQLSWTELSWPLDGGGPAMSSERGSFTVSGVPDDWALDGQLALQTGALPASVLDVSGRGTAESLEAVVHQGSLLGGKVSGELALNWVGNKDFSARVSASGIETNALLPDFPGVLNAELAASGALQPLDLDIDLQRVDGQIRDRPFIASGGLGIHNDQFHASRLKVRSGTSSLMLHGNPLTENGLEFVLDIDSLRALSDDLAGSIRGEGLLSLHPGSPRISATLNGQDLAIGALVVEELQLKDAGEGLVGSELQLSGIKVGQRSVERLSLVATGREPFQSIDINARVEETDIELALRGSVVDWKDPLSAGWSGSLLTMRLLSDKEFRLVLEEPAALSFSPDRLVLDDACISGSRSAQLCFRSAWLKASALSISANLASVPLGLLELFIDTDLEFTQILSGELQWTQPVGAQVSGRANIAIAPGAVFVLDTEEALLETGNGVFGFNLEKGQLREGTLDITLPGTGVIDLDFGLPDLQKGLDSAIQGRARIDLTDLAAVSGTIPLIEISDGEMHVDVRMSGTLADPAFNGSASLEAGRLENAASGFSFSDITISGEVNEFDNSRLKGSFRAGDGAGEISATVNFKNMLSPVVSVALKGDSLTIIEVPDLKVIANPDISLHWQDQTLDVNGRLVIPAARLSPSYLPEGSIVESEDIVIVAGEIPAPESDLRENRRFGLRGQLEVELGEQVEIDLEMAQANVRGSAIFTWQDMLIPVAEGSFDVSGELEAYGQLLRVTRGRIGFPRIPADNPHLNIRAEREIYGNSQIRRAGLMVAGTLRRPVIEAYTVPMTNKERAQTLLVTGSDFNFEKGVGAVDVGTYISPRLYIGYGIGIFEEGNIITARYELGRGFGVKATSSQQETGLGINYRIER